MTSAPTSSQIRSLPDGSLRRPGVAVHLGDCLDVLIELPSQSIDAIVTDPPYAIASRPTDLKAFRGKSSGSCQRCDSQMSAEGYVLCPHCLDTTRTQALMGAPMLGQQSQNWHEKATHSRGYADNDNQVFQAWCDLWTAECFRVLKPGGHILAFGGTRTWHRLTCAVEDAGFEIRDGLAWIYGTGYPKGVNVGNAMRNHHTADPELGASAAQRWEGWGTTLKPAHEPIVFARKPLDGTVVSNALAHGTGPLNLAGCSIKDGDGHRSVDVRIATNVFLDQSQADLLDVMAGDPVSRFFWVAKPGNAERIEVDGVAHPTVKPLDLMRELVRLITPLQGVVLDPFAGSGTTVEACLLEHKDVIAIERDAIYMPLIEQRIDRVLDPLKAARRNDTTATADLFS